MTETEQPDDQQGAQDDEVVSPATTKEAPGATFNRSMFQGTMFNQPSTK